MKQKVIKIGSSIGVVLPKPLAEEKGIRAGSLVSLRTVEGSPNITIEPATTAASTDVQGSVARARLYIEKYRKDFEALANK